jgi:MerR family transcriptional regulator, mercuric resistance operon regulatory protein
MPRDDESLTVSRVARAAKVNVETIRYYQRRGLLRRPPKPAQGYRSYPPETVERICFIKRAQELGFTLAEIENLLALGEGHCRETRELAEHKLDLIRSRIHDLHEMEQVLAKLIRACGKQAKTPGCPIIKTLSRS